MCRAERSIEWVVCLLLLRLSVGNDMPSNQQIAISTLLLNSIQNRTDDEVGFSSFFFPFFAYCPVAAEICVIANVPFEEIAKEIELLTRFKCTELCHMYLLFVLSSFLSGIDASQPTKELQNFPYFCSFFASNLIKINISAAQPGLLG